MSKPKQNFEEVLKSLEQYIQEYKTNKSVECYKKIKKACRTLLTDTVNPTTPPPTTRP